VTHLRDQANNGNGHPRLISAKRPEDATTEHRCNLFLRTLPDADLRRIAPHLKIKEFDPGEIIHHDGDLIQNIIFPHDTTISLFSIMTDGTTVEIASIGSEGYVGVEIMLGSAVATCCAATPPGRVSTIALDRLLILVDQIPSLRAAMQAYARNYLDLLGRLVACNALHTLKQRMCRRLLLALDQTEQRPLIITQEQLARALGAGRTSVNQTCKELRQNNIIDYTRGHIRIMDLEGLEEAACECYSYFREALLTRNRLAITNA
jgi:CRP-like cAMP-binding protein